MRYIRKNLVVPQEVVQHLLVELDTEAVELRRKKRLRRRQNFNKESNYLWQMDSYDKLKALNLNIMQII